MWTPQQNKSGFSIIVAILVSAFLIVLSMGVLDLILGERRITKVVYNTISGYAGAEGALELALLKVKNHRDGFSDQIELESDNNSNLLTADMSSPKRTEQKITYAMETRSSDFSGATTGSGEFVIIPLFYDDCQTTEACKDPITGNDTEMRKTQKLEVIIGDDVVWNIIGNNTNGDTEGLVGTGNIIAGTEGKMKKMQIGCDVNADSCDIDFSQMKVLDFMEGFGGTPGHSDNYLILFSDQPFSYQVKSGDDISGNQTFFTLPKTTVIATAQIGEFIQNIAFTEDKSRLFDALKYSVFTEDLIP